MQITVDSIKELRQLSGAGVMDCRSALMESEGDIQKAIVLLKEQSLVRVEKKAERVATQGLIETYIHTGGRIGAMVELNCETDFVARTLEFRELAHDVAMQVAAQEPLCIGEDEVPEDTEVTPDVACLLLQPFIKDPSLSIRDLITETAAKVGENVRVRRFARFELGQADWLVAQSGQGGAAKADE